MSYLETAKNQVLSAVGKVVDAQPRAEASQTVTIAVAAERVEQFWRDPGQLSVVLGDIGEVEAEEGDRYRWRLQDQPDVSWQSQLVAEPGGVRYVGTDDDNELEASYRAAPHDLGTEVTLRVKTPAPGLLSGAAAFKVLYRLRALLQTGEVPTIQSNPSARDSAR